MSGVAVATVAHDAPLCRWSCTAAPGSGGRTVPLTAPAFTDASTTGSTGTLTSAARTSPAASRYCVVACGLTTTLKLPLASGVTGGDRLPRRRRPACLRA